MTQSKPHFAPVLRSLLEEDARATGHATPEQLLDHRAGSLPPDQAALLDRHLRGCQECAGLLRDLAEFEEFTPAPADEAMADAQARAAWERLSARLPERPVEPAAVPLSRPVPISQPSSGSRMQAVPEPRREPQKPDFVDRQANLRVRLRFTYALAASLFVGIVGLLAWGRDLRQQLEGQSQPQLNPAIHDLEPVGEGTRGLGEQGTPLSPQVSTALVLHSLASAGETFDVEIADRNGKPLWRGRGLRKNAEGDYVVQIPQGFLSEGTYRLRVYASRGRNQPPLKEYAFEVTSPH